MASDIGRRPPPPTPCHRLSPGWRLGITLTVLVLAGLLDFNRWPLLGLLTVVVFAGLSLAEVPLEYLLRRLGWFLPPIFLLGLSAPLGQPDEAGWLWAAGLWLRCTVCFLAGLWLIHVLPFPELLATLRRWHVPLVLVAMLGFMYRFLFILWDELDRMRQARAARTSRPVGWRMAWKTSAMMLGQLLLRAWDRAERVHRAMLARGWDGSVKSLDGEWGSGI